MSDSDSFEHKSEQPLTKTVKLQYDSQPNDLLDFYN